jgi:hypothetical protein
VTPPYVGEIVHYRYRPEDEPSPAVITHVHDDTWVSLFIIGPGATRYASHVERNVGWKPIPAYKAPDSGLDALFGGWRSA